MSVAVLRKAFVTLESLAAEGPCSLGVLAQSAEFPKPTLHRILKTLRGLGYVRQDIDSGEWSISEQIADLADSGAALKRQAQPIMDELYERFGETVNLGVMRGIYIRYLHVLETQKPLRHVVQPGTADPFYCTALGRALAAHLPEQALSRLLEQVQNHPKEGKRCPRPEELRSILKSVRKSGVAIDEEETVAGVFCIGIPLFNVSRPVAAISVSVPTARLTSALRRSIQIALLEHLK